MFISLSNVIIALIGAFLLVMILNRVGKGTKTVSIHRKKLEKINKVEIYLNGNLVKSATRDDEKTFTMKLHLPKNANPLTELLFTLAWEKKGVSISENDVIDQCISGMVEFKDKLYVEFDGTKISSIKELKKWAKT